MQFACLVMWCVVDAGKRSEIDAREYIPSSACVAKCFHSRVIGEPVVVLRDFWSVRLRLEIGDLESCALFC